MLMVFTGCPEGEREKSIAFEVHATSMTEKNLCLHLILIGVFAV